STPASAIGSRIRTLIAVSGRDGALERLERGSHGDAAIDVGAELGQRELDGRERARDVEHVEPADVADPEDAALQRALARCERDAVAIAQVAEQLVAVDAFRGADRRDDRRRVVVRGEELESHRLDPGAGREPEPDVPLEG